MRMSAAHCREQQALQLAKAANEPLESRRKIALTAAKAWEVEAALAEKRASDLSPLTHWMPPLPRNSRARMRRA